MKTLNVVWCDDNIEALNIADNQRLFESHNCQIYKTAKTSDKLKKILDENKDLVDAVIVDFNMSDKDLIPSKSTASGFRWVHEHLSEYHPIPFYLYSARDQDFIESKYRDFEYSKTNDYFFSPNKNVSAERNRYYQATELDELLSNIEEEVSTISTPLYKIRQEYSNAFNAISYFQLDPMVFLKILSSDEDIDRYEISNTANPLRKEIEKLFSQFADEGIIPTTYLSEFNKIPSLLGGEKEGSEYYALDDRMPTSLTEAFKFFLKYTQDGSHTKNYLSIDFDKYLRKTGDIYIVKALAIIGLDVINWAYPFYLKYQPLHLCSFQPFETVVNKIIQVGGKEGAIALDSNNKKYFIPQPPAHLQKYRYEVGTKVRIESCTPTTKEYGDFYVPKARNLNSI